VADVRFLPEAEADADAALAWYQARSPAAAAGFQVALDDAVQRVSDFPEAYALIDDRHRQCQLRRYPYSLIYRVEPDGVLVVAVAHSSRSASFWSGRG
jgi:plasmid stabilization system protein ParE